PLHECSGQCALNSGLARHVSDDDSDTVLSSRNEVLRFTQQQPRIINDLDVNGLDSCDDLTGLGGLGVFSAHRPTLRTRSALWWRRDAFRSKRSPTIAAIHGAHLAQALYRIPNGGDCIVDGYRGLHEWFATTTALPSATVSG